MHKEKDFPFQAVPIVISTIASVTYLFFMVTTGRMDKMQGIIIGSTIAIVIALIGITAGIWIQAVRFKKDSNNSGIEPLVQINREDFKMIRDEVVEKIVPDIKYVSRVVTGVESGVLKLVEEMNYQKRTKNELIAYIHKENARLSMVLTQEREKNQELLLENQSFQSQLEQYQSREQDQNQDR